MVARLDRQLRISNEVFSFKQLLDDPIAWLPLISTCVRPTTFLQKTNESEEDYLNRLFCLLYYKKKDLFRNCNYLNSTNFSRRRCYDQQIDSCYDTLNVLGINIVRHNAKKSRIVFKNSGNQYHIKNENIDKLVESIKKNVEYKRNKLNVTIGVEIEFIGHRFHIDDFNKAIKKVVGSKRYECLLHYSHNDGSKWILGTDGSIRTDTWEDRGFELTSPKLNPSSKKDMGELNSVLTLIKTIMSGTTNRSCGTHIHMSFKQPFKNSSNICDHFARSYGISEASLFDKLVPLNRRSNRSRWCRSNLPCRWVNSRYYKLNLANADTRSDYLHLEFRQLDGTLDFEKIYSWIKVQTLFTELTVDSYRKSIEESDDTTVEINFEEVILDKSFTKDNIEALLKMSKMIA